MSLRTFRPCPPLAPYIDAFWDYELGAWRRPPLFWSGPLAPNGSIACGSPPATRPPTR